MPPWSIGNALVVTRKAVSMLAVMSTKDGGRVFRIGLYGRSARALYYFFM